MSTLLPALISAAVAALALAFLRRSGRLPRAYANARSLHEGAVPRGGGLAIWIGWSAAVALLPGPRPWLLPLLALVLVSLFDDRHGMPVTVRLLVQVGAAAAWLLLLDPASHFAFLALIVTAVVWMANLYNFMDGSDGLAGSMALSGFGAYALAAFWAGAAPAPLLLALAAAVAPFLLANLPPARVFLGDVGAVPLGFLAAVFGVEGSIEGWWPAWFPLLVFLPFIADASATLARRAFSGERIWSAHRDHYYQRLVRLGFGHGGALALYAALMVGTAASALAALARAPGAGLYLVAEWAAVLALLFAVIGHHWRHRSDVR